MQNYQWGFLSILLPLASFAASPASFEPATRQRGKTRPHNVLIVGATSYEDLSERISVQSLAQPIGYIFTDASGDLCFRGESGEESPCSLDEILDSHVVDDVIVVDSCQGLDLDDILYACSIRGKTFRTLMRTPLAPAGRYRTESLGAGQFLLSHESVPAGRIALALKRATDVIGALAGLVLCALAALVYAARIRRETEGSVIFRQTRIGRNGRPFTIFKFRTMHVSAEHRLPELQKRNEMKGEGLIFKIRDDPRITPLGRKLRRRYLDELPQFWNVLKGEMSLVGTRPPTPAEVACYKPHHQRRLSMRPGLTGLWQLQGNNEIRDFERIVELDCRYIDTWSVWQDYKIIIYTILRVFRGGGY